MATLFASFFEANAILKKESRLQIYYKTKKVCQNNVTIAQHDKNFKKRV
jgi:hypothetical protein